MSISLQNITAFILIGGKSTRMGRAKHLLPFQETSFIQHQFSVLSKIFTQVNIVKNKYQADVENLRSIQDVLENQGPLAGIYTALQNCKTEYAFIISCDLPFITPSMILQFIADSEERELNLAQIEANKFPLFIIVSKHSLSKIESLIHQNNLSLHQMYDTCDRHLIDMKKFGKHFLNINTPEDLELLKSLINEN